MIRYTCPGRQGKPTEIILDLAIRFQRSELFDFLFLGWVIVVVGMGILPLGELVGGRGRHGSAGVGNSTLPNMVSYTLVTLGIPSA